jgi:hypothetical protein
MHPEGFKHKRAASDRLQTYALYRAPLGPRRISLILCIFSAWIEVGGNLDDAQQLLASKGLSASWHIIIIIIIIIDEIFYKQCFS